MDEHRKKAERALTFLSETDLRVVEEEGEFKRLEQVLKSTKAALFQCGSGTIDLKKADAETHEESRKAWSEMHEAWLKWRKTVMRRETAIRCWEDWRSYSKAKREGQVL